MESDLSYYQNDYKKLVREAKEELDRDNLLRALELIGLALDARGVVHGIKLMVV